MAQAPSIEGASPTEPDDPDAVALSPLIIAGAPRSGTSWLQKLILAHPQCTGGQESHLLVLFDGMLSECRRKAAFPRPHGPLGLVTEEEFIRSLRKTWARVFEPILDDHPQATLLVEKTPDHILHLELADRLLPNCRVVHLVRHPAEVAASLVRASREPWGRGWAPGSIEAATRRWLECAEAGSKAATRLGALDASRPFDMKISGRTRGNNSRRSLPSPASNRRRSWRPGSRRTTLAAKGHRSHCVGIWETVR